jgi:hypothetical protein
MKCLLRKDAGLHALILTSPIAQNSIQKFTGLKTVPTLKTVNTSTIILHAKLAKLATPWQLQMGLARNKIKLAHQEFVVSSNVSLDLVARMESVYQTSKYIQ